MISFKQDMKGEMLLKQEFFCKVNF